MPLIIIIVINDKGDDSDNLIKKSIITRAFYCFSILNSSATLHIPSFYLEDFRFTLAILVLTYVPSQASQQNSFFMSPFLY